MATTGSLGDLNPMLAIGERLLAEGASVTFATLSSYEGACRKSGFRFLPLGDSDDYVRSLRYSREMLEEQSMAQFVERVNFDQLDLVYGQLLAAASDADVLVAPSHVIPAHLVAEKKSIPYVACALCLIHIKSPAATGSVERRELSAAAARWNSTLRKFRLDNGLGRRVLPFASLLHDARKVLGVLPSFLLSADEMRIPNLTIVGYADHHQTERMFPDEALRAFCDERTVAFSFGSFADACDPDYFFAESVAACRALNLKCIYLSRHVTPAMLQSNSGDVLVRTDVAPGAVFPLVGSVVHHGGTGTLVAACCHAKPMVIVPFFLDQPMHAERMQSLIGSPQILARNYHRDPAAQALEFARSHREPMVARLRMLMAEYNDGARQAAQQILLTLTG